MLRAILPYWVLSMLLIGCAKEKFTSESNWLAPLLETKITLGDLVPDSIKRTNTDGSIDIVYEEKYGISSLSDILQIPDRVENIEVTLESLVLEDRTFIDTLTLKEIYPASILLHGQTTPLEAQDVQTSQGTKLDVSKEFFETATFVEGWIDITISNDLPVTAEIMEFELLNDDGSGTVVVSGTFTNLAPNTTQTQTYSLAGKTVKGKLELRVKRVKTAASNGPVLVDVNKGLRINFTVRGLKPQTATAIFPAQNLVDRKDETKYEFGGAELTQVNVKTGSILMKVESSIEESIILEYSIPQSSKEGQTGFIKKEWRIPAAAKGSVVYLEERFPIDGFVIHLYGKSPHSTPAFNHIYNELIARIEYSGVERTLSLDDKIKIEFGLIDVIPKLIIGDPGLHKFAITDTLQINSLKNLNGGISLEDATLDLEFYNSFGIETSINIKHLTSENSRTSKSVELFSNDLSNGIFLERAVNHGTYVEAKMKSIKLDKGNSNLKLFLENLPDKVRPDLEVIVRPNGTLNQNDFGFDSSQLSMNFKLNVPLSFGLDSLSFSKSIKANILRDETLSKIKEVKLLALVSNDFPIQGTIELIFKNDDGQIVAQMFKNHSNIIEAAEIDYTSGKTISATETELVASLSRDEMYALQNTSNVIVSVLLATEDARRYKMYTDYSMKLRLITEIVYENKF